MSAKDKLAKDLEKGPVKDLEAFSNALQLYKAIEEHSTFINKSGYKNLFSPMLNMILDSLIIRLSKIFDKFHNQYPKRSLPVILKHIKEHAKEIEMENPNFLLDKFSLKTALPKSPPGNPNELKRIFEKLKNFRDIETAHPQTDDVEPLKFSELQELANHAQSLIKDIKWAYLGQKWSLSETPCEAIKSFERMLTKLGEP